MLSTSAAASFELGIAKLLKAKLIPPPGPRYFQNLVTSGSKKSKVATAIMSKMLLKPMGDVMAAPSTFYTQTMYCKSERVSALRVVLLRI